jgi:predicted RecA/RadA family phage recombinase
MTRRRGVRLTAVWVVTTAATTVWVTAKTEEVSAGNAMLVGVVLATALTAALAGVKRE